MVSFGALNFSNFRSSPVGTSASETVVDVYNKIQEKKDNYIAVTLANDNNRKERASATMIGAVGGLLQFGVLAGVYALVKAFPKFNHPLIDRFVTKNFDKWLNVAVSNNPGKSKIQQQFIGLYAKALYATGTGAALGFGFDWFKTLRNTIVDGKISNTKSGVNGSSVASGLKSLSASDKGKKIIREAIHRNPDKSVTVKFKGINQEYNLTKEELNKASKSYVTYTNSEGKVTNFKKKFSKGDGDVLAFELAFEKYCQDVNDGKLPQDKNVPASVLTLSDTGDILFTNATVNQLYYLLNGKNYMTVSNNEASANTIKDMYLKASFEHFFEKYSENPEKYAGEIKLKENESGKIKIRDKFLAKRVLKTANNYSILNVDKKYVTLANADNTKEQFVLPVSGLKEFIDSVSYTTL